MQSDFSMLTAVQFFKVSDPLSGSKGASPFKPVIREEFSEAVVPSYQKNNGKRPFCHLKIIIFLITLLYSAGYTLNPQVKHTLNAVCTDRQQ